MTAPIFPLCLIATERSPLAQNVIFRNAAFAINERCGALAQAIKKLTASMHEWNRVNPGRTSRTIMQRAGSVLRSAHDWEVTPPSPAETYCSGINLDIAATENPDIHQALEGLRCAARMGRSGKSAPTGPARL